MQKADDEDNMAPTEDGLLFACLLDGKGGAKPVGWSEVDNWTSKKRPLWIHLDRSSPEARNWLHTRSGLTQPTVEAILSEESRPRVFRGKRGYVAIIRALNQNEGADNEDMVALRIWCDGQRLITVRQRQLFVPRQIFKDLTEEADGPHKVPGVFCQLIDRVVRQMSDTIAGYENEMDTLELKAESESSSPINRELADLRRRIIEFRRYIAPQREALGHLLAEPPGWFGDEQRPLVREAADRQQRYLEELDEARERTVIVKDDLTNRLNQQMNRNMYVISVIAAIFLPLSFVTGLLGINVGGMPGVEYGAAFWITCVLLVALLVGELWIFRKLKWF